MDKPVNPAFAGAAKLLAQLRAVPNHRDPKYADWRKGIKAEWDALGEDEIAKARFLTAAGLGNLRGQALRELDVLDAHDLHQYALIAVMAMTQD